MHGDNVVSEYKKVIIKSIDNEKLRMKRQLERALSHFIEYFQIFVFKDKDISGYDAEIINNINKIKMEILAKDFFKDDDGKLASDILTAVTELNKERANEEIENLDDQDDYKSAVMPVLTRVTEDINNEISVTIIDNLFPTFNKIRDNNPEVDLGFKTDLEFREYVKERLAADGKISETIVSEMSFLGSRIAANILKANKDLKSEKVTVLEQNQEVEVLDDGNVSKPQLLETLEDEPDILIEELNPNLKKVA